LHILGLEVCADTIVGNAMLRGISGGQRKRVTTCKTNLISILKPNKMIICVNFNNYKFLNAGEMLVGLANA